MTDIAARPTVRISDALMQAEFLRAASETWRLDAELLLAEALACRRETLHAWPEREVPESALQTFRHSLKRRLAGEPMAYILGRKGFWDFELRVNADVLIPRPETELLVEAVLGSRFGQVLPLDVADLGTGSGAIAIAIARARPDWRLTAVDISSPALAVARQNAQELAPGRIEFVQGAWCAPLPDQSLDLLCANPPYVRKDDDHLLQDGLPFEPEGALVGGEDGLRDLRMIIRQSPRVLKTDGWLYLEHGMDQAATVRGLMQEAGFASLGSHRDYSGHERVSFGRLESMP